VLLTLLSLIQAIALEGLWSRSSESPHLWSGGIAALVGWLQVSSIVFGILLVWLMYVGMVIRFPWTPRTRDSLFPFGMGLLEFAAIEMTGPNHPATMMLLMGSVYAVATWAANDIFVRAAREAGNESARLVDGRALLFPLSAVVLHLALAAGIALGGGYGAFAAFGFGVIHVLLLVQSWMIHRSTSGTRRLAAD
jgi:hypothetical protein